MCNNCGDKEYGSLIPGAKTISPRGLGIAGADKVDSEIGEEITRYDRLIVQLSSVIDRFDSKLSPILSNSNESDSGRPIKERNSKLGQTLQTFNESFNSKIDTLNDIADRIQL